MITKPGISRPINTIDEMLEQTETPWLLEDGSGLYYYMLNSAEESNMRKVFDRAKMASWEDIVAAVEGKDYIIPTVGIATEEWSSQDFENTGKCNFYKIGGKFLFASFSMALKVMHSYAWMKVRIYWVGSPQLIISSCIGHLEDTSDSMQPIRLSEIQ